MSPHTKNYFPKAQKNAPLSPHTTFGLGGRVEYLLGTADPAEVVAAVQTAKKNKIPYYLIGGGSNIVCNNQAKIKGLVVVYCDKSTPNVIPAQAGIQDLSGEKSGCLQINKKNREIICNCCLPLSRLVEISISQGWAGLESLTAIPGMVGGAIVGNAGAYGHSISETLDSVTVFDPTSRDASSRRSGQMRRLSKKECQFSYRDSIFKKKRNLILLSARFKFRSGDKKELQKISAKIAADRLVKYGNIKSPGSFFKNVLVAKVSKKTLSKIDQTKIIDGKIPTGYLLAEVGAKGMKMGGLEIADYHGNLITNKGGATYKDVTKLVKILKERVYEKFGIKLEEEVRYLI